MKIFSDPTNEKYVKKCVTFYNMHHFYGNYILILYKIFMYFLKLKTVIIDFFIITIGIISIILSITTFVYI